MRARKRCHGASVWGPALVLVLCGLMPARSAEAPGAAMAKKAKLKLQISVVLDVKPVDLPRSPTHEDPRPVFSVPVSSVDLLCTATNEGDGDAEVCDTVGTRLNTLWVRSGDQPARPMIGPEGARPWIGPEGSLPTTRIVRPEETTTWRIRDVYGMLSMYTAQYRLRKLGVYHAYWKVGDFQSNELSFYRDRVRDVSELDKDEATEELQRLNKKASLTPEESKLKRNLDGLLAVLDRIRKYREAKPAEGAAEP